MSISAEKLYEPLIDNEKSSQPSKFTKVVSTAFAGVLSSPGVAFCITGLMTEGILKVSGATLDLVSNVALLPFSALSGKLFEVSEKKNNRVAKVGTKLIGGMVGLPTIAGVPLILTSGILKITGVALNIALNLVAMPSLYVGKKILQKGNPELYDSLIDNFDERE